MSCIHRGIFSRGNGLFSLKPIKCQTDCPPSDALPLARISATIQTIFSAFCHFIQLSSYGCHSCPSSGRVTSSWSSSRFLLFHLSFNDSSQQRVMYGIVSYPCLMSFLAVPAVELLHWICVHFSTLVTVSYTHLTLPTKRIV